MKKWAMRLLFVDFCIIVSFHFIYGILLLNIIIYFIFGFSFCYVEDDFLPGGSKTEIGRYVHTTACFLHDGSEGSDEKGRK
jgi:hypothetical protein